MILFRSIHSLIRVRKMIDSVGALGPASTAFMAVRALMTSSGSIQVCCTISWTLILSSDADRIARATLAVQYDR